MHNTWNSWSSSSPFPAIRKVCCCEVQENIRCFTIASKVRTIKRGTTLKPNTVNKSLSFNSKSGMGLYFSFRKAVSCQRWFSFFDVTKICRGPELFVLLFFSFYPTRSARKNKYQSAKKTKHQGHARHHTSGWHFQSIRSEASCSLFHSHLRNPNNYCSQGSPEHNRAELNRSRQNRDNL